MGPWREMCPGCRDGKTMGLQPSGEKGAALGKEVVCTEAGVQPKTRENPSCSRFPKASVMSHANWHDGRGVRCGQKEERVAPS